MTPVDLPLGRRLLVAVGCGVGVGVTIAGNLTPPIELMIQLVLLAMLGGALALVCWLRPAVGLVLLVVLLPLQQLVFPWALSKGVRLEAIQLSRFWKEGVVLVLLARMMTAHPRFSRTDRWVLMFIGTGFVFLVLPFGPPMSIRVLGLRQDIAFLAIFLIARHVPLPSNADQRIAEGLFTVAAVVAGIAIWNWLAPDAFAAWFRSLGIDAYYHQVVGGVVPTLVAYGNLGGATYVRAGSIFISPLSLAYFLVIPIGMLIGSAGRGVVAGLRLFSGALCVVALLFSLTRSSAATLPLMVGIGLVVGRRRFRLVTLIAVAALAMLPFFTQVTGAERLRGGILSDTASNADHLRSLEASRQQLEQSPLGAGLGTAGGVSRRLDPDAGLINESWYLQIATELGLFGLVLFLIVVVSVLWALWRRARAGDRGAVGPLCALAAVSAGGLVLHTFEEFAVAWTVWLLAGLALRSETAESLPEPSQSDRPLHEVRLHAV